MSGRVISYREDGTPIRGYRKTSRRNARRPLADRLYDLNVEQARRDPNAWPVRIGFLLPKDVAAFVASAPHGTGVNVRQGFVQVSSSSTDQGFARAHDFFSVIARGSIFTVMANVFSPNFPNGRFARHLTWVEEVLVVSAASYEPRIYE